MPQQRPVGATPRLGKPRLDKPRLEERRLQESVLWGFAAGLTYTLVDGYLDHTFGVQVSPPVRPVEVLHALIDFVLPAITGALFGVSVHYVKLRAKMAELEKQRADDLTGDLHKIERDQAVWVISASLLHELKNPLHALGLLLDEALETPHTEPEHQHRLLSRARAQVERISVELATLRALPSTTRPELPDIDLEELARATVAAVAQRAPQVTLSCRLDGAHELRARANPAYVRIILENLLENAVEALGEVAVTGERRIDVELRGEGGRCIIEVSDTGLGLDAETRAHLFEPLNTTKPAGMGLGLSIARALARAMGGDLVHVEQTLGARFRLSLDGGSAT
jgi:signal transduction histidine kinase